MKLRIIICLAIALLLFPQIMPLVQAEAQQQTAKKWVLTEAIINPLNVPLYNGKTEAFGTKIVPMDEIVTGIGIKQTVSETHITEEYKYVSTGKLQYDWLFQFDFERPPAELRVGDTITLKASGKATGTGTADSGTSSIFYYSSYNLPYPEGVTAVFSNALVIVDGVTGGRGQVRSKAIGLQPSRGTTEGSLVVQMKFPEYLQNSPGFTISAISTTYGLWVDWVYRPVMETQSQSASSPTLPASTPAPNPKPGTQNQDVIMPDGSINQTVFDRDWKKYSDLDDRIPLNERSYEAQQWAGVAQRIVSNKEQVFILQRDMEMDRLARLELLEYRKALITGIKVNLLKSFWRLAYVTYDTIAGKAGFGGGDLGLKGGSIALGETYSKLFYEAGTLEKIGAALKVMRGLTPGNSKVAINTDSILGKVKSVGLSTALDTVESLGDPQTVALTVFNSTAEQFLPSTADLSDEEIEILRKQSIDKRLIDDVLQESYRVNSERRLQVKALQTENKSLEAELQKWEQAEKDRVARELEAAWRAKK